MKKGLYYIDVSFFLNNNLFQIELKAFGKTLSAHFQDDDGTRVKVFVLELWKILSSDKFPLKNSTETLNGKMFIPFYISGYKKGREYFIKEYLLSNDTLYRNPDIYIKNLHNCYFHSDPLNNRHGWEYYKESFPIIIGNESVEKYGFYAGIFYELEELQKKHPVLFKDFENNCGLSDRTQHNATHREIIVAHNYKVQIGEVESKTPAQWGLIGGAKRRQAAYSTIKGGSTKYKPTSKKELQTVITLLQNSPQAQHLAINDLHQLQSL